MVSIEVMVPDFPTADDASGIVSYAAAKFILKGCITELVANVSILMLTSR